MVFKEGDVVVLRIPDSRRDTPYYKKFNGAVRRISEKYNETFVVLTNTDEGLWPVEWLEHFGGDSVDEDIEQIDINILIGGI